MDRYDNINILIYKMVLQNDKNHIQLIYLGVLWSSLLSFTLEYTAQ